jgi:hypothetical protein
MSLRPPATYWILVTATGAMGSSDSGNFQLNAGANTVPISMGATLRLQGIEFMSGANGGSFIASPLELPAGLTQPHNVTETIDAPSFMPIIPWSIDGGTTALPFRLCYGPLGAGAR